jgi:hypothetical protein
MKKTIIYLLIATISLYSTAQTKKSKKQHSKITFGIQGGVNMNNIVGTGFPNGDKLDNDFILGFHGGVNVDIPLFSSIYLEPGLQFITKGTKKKGTNYTETYNISYVEMPLNFVFKPQAGKGHFLIGLGADVAYGISGKWKYDEAGGTQNDVNGKIKFENSLSPSVLINPTTDKYVKPFDAAVGLLVGYQLGNGLFFQINGQYGVMNSTPKLEINDPTIVQGNAKNIGFGLSLGYRF